MELTVRWTDRAQAQLNAWIDYLADFDEQIARRARDATLAEVTKLERRFHTHRASRRWPGCQELLLSDWTKLIVYQVTSEPEVLILALFDQRRDLDRLNPLTE